MPEIIQPTATDEYVVDAIATLLGTSAEWSSAADYLDAISELVSLVRPSTGGSLSGRAYEKAFQAATGRPCPPPYVDTDIDELGAEEDDDDDLSGRTLYV